MAKSDHWFIKNLEKFDDQLALVFDDKEYTYHDITNQIKIYKNTLKLLDLFPLQNR